jgi:hypothetical protein
MTSRTAITTLTNIVRLHSKACQSNCQTVTTPIDERQQEERDAAIRLAGQTFALHSQHNHPTAALLSMVDVSEQVDRLALEPYYLCALNFTVLRFGIHGKDEYHHLASRI